MLSLQHSLTEPFIYIFPEDDAIDRDHPDYSADDYEETLDPKHLPAKPDGKPTKFYCKPLSRDAVGQIYDLFGSSRNQEAAQLAVSYGLENVVDGPRDVTIKRDKKGTRLTDASMDSLYECFGLAVLNRLGGVIVRRSTLSPF